jgi:imidazolonepropionase-like amidohydrolase
MCRPSQPESLWVRKPKSLATIIQLVVPKALEIGPQIQKTFAEAYKRGVKIAFGTDAGGISAWRKRKRIWVHG